MFSNQFVIVGLGEILWDLLPRGKQLGGAPANFAYMAARLGDRGIVASRVGSDELGQQAHFNLERLGLSASHLQVDEAHSTGTVLVRVDGKGQPDFTIAETVAWDFLAWTPLWENLAAQADAVCFGSLAQRSPVSRETIRRFLEATRSEALRIFDVNLRQPFFSAEVLSESFERCNVVKLNHDELREVAELLGLGGGGEVAWALKLIRVYGLTLVCVTRGEHGSLMVTDAEIVEHPGRRIAVADAVGAGDAFTAALAYHYLRKERLGIISEAANRLGAWVASQVGATPQIKQDVVEAITERRQHA